LIDGKPLAATMRRLVNVQLVKLIDISNLDEEKSSAARSLKNQKSADRKGKTGRQKNVWLATNYSSGLIKM